MLAGVWVMTTFATSLAVAQSLYKYRGADGEWIFTDRPPDDGQVDEVRALNRPAADRQVRVEAQESASQLRFYASNPYHAPVELALRFSELKGLQTPTERLVWILPAESKTELIALEKVGGTVNASFEFEYMLGNPEAMHRPDAPYRAPFAIANNFPVTQAYPDIVTHATPDSRYAVDIAMPVGTNVFAARAGTVIDVSADNFASGLDPARDGPAANIVQIMHADGTYAVYAHLNWNTIRVKPGDAVARGQYIADSGNTGFSSGPHLHFVVLRNTGMQTISVPVQFLGNDSRAVTPASGGFLTAY
jgi:murein DD-endopeptidase MepM/ murein hydrolase activator NlpD